MLNIVAEIGEITMMAMIMKLMDDKDKRSKALRASIGMSEKRILTGSSLKGGLFF